MGMGAGGEGVYNTKPVSNHFCSRGRGRGSERERGGY